MKPKMLKFAMGIRAKNARTAVTIEGQAAIGNLLAFALPKRRSMVHCDDIDGHLHPYGSTWRFVASNEFRHCSHCRSIHPLSFLDLVESIERWKPYEAQMEMMRLIEQGEIQPTMERIAGTGHPPEGFAVLNLVGMPGAARINVHTSDCEHTFMALCHLSDLSDGEFARFEKWVKAMPELTVDRDALGRCLANYDADHDPMIPPPELQRGIAIIIPQQDPNTEPTGDPE